MIYRRLRKDRLLVVLFFIKKEEKPLSASFGNVTAFFRIETESSLFIINRKHIDFHAGQKICMPRKKEE